VPATHDIIVVAGSAGGLEALSTLARGLPEGLPAAIFVMLHSSTYSRDNLLAHILRKIARVPVVAATDGLRIASGKIYCAHSGRHLILERGRMRLTLGPQENRARPSADALFRSAALRYGPRVIGVILTGLLDDGTAGLVAIKARGGLAAVQAPSDALYPDMPRNALRYVKADVCVPMVDMAGVLARLAERPAADDRDFPVPAGMEADVRVSEGEIMPIDATQQQEGPSPVVCPECGGWMIARKEGSLLRFRCHTGHAFSPSSLIDGQSAEVERHMFSALRVLDEMYYIARELLERARAENRTEDIADLESRMHKATEARLAMRKLLQLGSEGPPEPP
jgi:two-component system chemotaxis response regulator CheB